ncbi:acyl carrier protein [Nonomuraea sp. NPDC050404]|uniref:acyl carrier protein n=1 Tax=Nonomuraea sp. NPDC050404 TaxID=3155783 RepID=UPI0033ED5098
MGFDELKEILAGLGVEEDQLRPGHRLRADLALDSTETTELGLELERRFGAVVELWDVTDYSLAELARLVEGSSAADGF